MFWVMIAGTLPARYSEANARCPRPGFAAANVGSIANRRRHASSRASGLATNSSNGIGRLRVHNPPGERKSGIPHSVEMPAPVKGTMVDAAAIMSPSCSTPLRRSGAIICDYPKSGRAHYRHGQSDCHFGTLGIVHQRRPQASSYAAFLTQLFLRDLVALLPIALLSVALSRNAASLQC